MEQLLTQALIKEFKDSFEADGKHKHRVVPGEAACMQEYAHVRLRFILIADVIARWPFLKTVM